MDLSQSQLDLLAEARLYVTEAGGCWYEHGQAGQTAKKLAKLGLVEFRPASGGVGNYVAPAIRLTEAGTAAAEEHLKVHRDRIDDLMQRKIRYIERNLKREGK